jgi:uncharacterized protein YbcC (UPF0753/DUF2309 family)
MSQQIFDDKKLLQELKHYLPSQTPIKDFIHHNSLHAYQHMKFYDAIFKASKIFGFQVTLELKDFRKLYKNGRIKTEVFERTIAESKGAENLDLWIDKLLFKDYDTHNEPRIGKLRDNWKSIYGIDLDNLVQPLLFRILCSYLDQGVSLWQFPLHEEGFLASLKELEKNSPASFFKTKKAKQLFLSGEYSITGLLKSLAGEEAYFEQYIFDQQFTHQGWSGMVSAVEDAPHTLLDGKKITLHELVVFELLLELDALDFELGNKWMPLSTVIETPPVDLFGPVPLSEFQEALILWQKAFEWSYYDEVLCGIRDTAIRDPMPPDRTEPSFQAIFCIDERECSIRRHLEATDPRCETLGSPGFFGVEFYFQPQEGKFYEKLCPAPVTPQYLVKESGIQRTPKQELLYRKETQTLVKGTLGVLPLGFFAGLRLIQNLFSPSMSPAISNAYAHMHKGSVLSVENRDPNDRENGLQVGFSVEEMTIRVEGLLRGIGLAERFARIIYVVAHGSSSANNPHHSAHDCGACSGRPGSVNARVFAHMANHPKVRARLAEKGIHIPATTQFVAGLHDTAADQVEFYDESVLEPENAKMHLHNRSVFEKALDLNAKERSRRFASINTKSSLQKVRKEILKRSVSLFEPRPELGHGTNTLCIIGSRSLTKSLFLDRRSFLNSYDYRTDPDGKLLAGVMRPIGLVCGGINLEYYFSRVDNHKLGAGTKLPHNVMGLIGVANSCDGDLRPGLPVQMIEVHDPVRLLVIVEHFPEIVLKTIQSTPEMYEWYKNEWVHIMAIHPGTREFYYFNEEKFTPYHPTEQELAPIKDPVSFFENAAEMETNHISHATQENLPVHVLN